MRGERHDPLKLRSYCTEVHHICIQYSQIITDELYKNDNSDIANRFRMPGRRIKVNSQFRQF